MENLLFIAIKAAVLAGEEILKVKKQGFTVDTKADESPVTVADLASNKIIQDLLKDTGIPVLSEESKILAYSERKLWKALWIVDPLDGTKEFIKNKKEYTTNVALYKDGKITIGAVYVPELKTLYFASEIMGSFVLEINDLSLIEDIDQLISKAQKLPLKKVNRPFTVVASKSHLSPETQVIIDKLNDFEKDLLLESYGSSLKLCKVAEGSAQVYPRIAPTMEWDIAASIAIVKYAGMEIKSFPDLKEVAFNKENLLNPYFIVYTPEYSDYIDQL